MDRRKSSQAAQQVEVIAEWQRRIEPADDMELGKESVYSCSAKRNTSLSSIVYPPSSPGFGVRALAKLAIDDANVRVIDVAVDVVIREIAVQSLTLLLASRPNNDVVGAVKFKPFFEGQALPASHLVLNLNPIDHHAPNYTCDISRGRTGLSRLCALMKAVVSPST